MNKDNPNNQAYFVQIALRGGQTLSFWADDLITNSRDGLLTGVEFPNATPTVRFLDFEAIDGIVVEETGA